MDRALQKGSGRPAERVRGEYECDRKKDNAGWSETKDNRLAGNQADHKDSGNYEANGRGNRTQTQVDGPLQLIIERGTNKRAVNLAVNARLVSQASPNSMYAAKVPQAIKNRPNASALAIEGSQNSTGCLQMVLGNRLTGRGSVLLSLKNSAVRSSQFLLPAIS